jgi:hypothetical protein
MTAAVVGYVASAVMFCVGVGWFSFGAGLIAGGLCAAALTTLLLLEVPGGGDE